MGPVQTPLVYPAEYDPDSISVVGSSRCASPNLGDRPGRYCGDQAVDPEGFVPLQPPVPHAILFSSLHWRLKTGDRRLPLNDQDLTRRSLLMY